MSRAVKLQAAIDNLVEVVMELREADKGDDTGMCLGDYIAQQRSAWGLSLQGLSDKSGISKPHLHALEQSHSVNPSVDLIEKLAVALACPPIHILNAALNSQRLLGKPTP